MAIDVHTPESGWKMWSRIANLCLFSLACALGPVLSAQAAPQQPPRDSVRHSGDAQISGTLVDGRTHQAIRGAHVQLSSSGGGDAIATETGVDGSFSFRGITPGSYLLLAQKGSYLPGRYPSGAHTVRSRAEWLAVTEGQRLEVVFPLSHGSALSGRVVDEAGDPIESGTVRAIPATSAASASSNRGTTVTTNDLGAFRIPHLADGAYYLVAAPPQGAGAHSAQGVSGGQKAAPTFYPGVVSIEAAVPLTVKGDQTLANLEIPLSGEPTHVVSGQVLDATSVPLTSGSVRFMDRRALTLLLPVVVPIRGDGTFLAEVSAGDYDIVASGGNGRAGDTAAARANVAGDLTNFVLHTAPPARISGRVEFEGSTPTSAAAIAALKKVFTIGAWATGSGTCQAGHADIAEDLSFQITGLLGNCIVRANIVSPTLEPASLRWSGGDLLDDARDFLPGDVLENAILTVSDKRTQLVLDVVDGSGAPTDDYVAVAFSTDPSKWSRFSRYVRIVKGSNGPQPGHSVLVGLPQGSYYVIALDDVDADVASQPGALQRLLALATRVNVSDVGTPVQLRRADK